MSRRPEVFQFEGITISHYFTDNWERVKNFKARPDDILIATYPKSGTTWMSEILDQLYFSEIRKKGPTIPLYERVPFLEFCCEGFPLGTEAAESLPTSPRLIKTHLPVHLIPQSFWDQNCRVIYVARNPKDTTVSYYHFDRMNHIQPDPGQWEEYINKFNAGQLVFGSWYDHVQGWWEKSLSYYQILYMFFEDMKEDLAREISRVCSFLGLSPTQNKKEEVQRATTFEEMKNIRLRSHSSVAIMDESISPFLRKGRVGDWKNHFTVAQSEAFDEKYRKRMKSGSLTFRMQI